MDYCQVIKNIEKDSSALVPIKTVRDWLLLRAHISTCEECIASVERVMKNSPPGSGISIGLN